MKIVTLGPVYPYRGGISAFTTLFGRALHEAGHDHLHVSFKRLYPKWLYPGETDRDPSKQTLDTDAVFSLDSLNPMSWFGTANRIIDEAPDVIVVMWWTTFLAPAYWTIARRLGQKNIPLIFLIHNVLPHEQRPGDVAMTRAVLSKANSFILQTRREQEKLLELLPASNTVICPHPVYDMFSNNRVTKTIARKKLSLPEDRQVLLFFGFVRSYKGLKYLIDAMSILKSQGLPPVLLVGGEFWEGKDLYQKQIDSLGLQEDIFIFDRYIPNEDVSYFFSASDVFVAPYTGGTQSGSLKLAMGFGLRSVVTETISALEPGEGPDPLTLVVPPADARALAEAIRKQLLSPEGAASPATGEAGWGRFVKAVEVFGNVKKG